MKILFVASESHPYVTTGGLAGVVGSLAKALSRAGHEVRICIPLYAVIDRRRFGIQSLQTMCVHMGTGEVWCALHQCDHGDGVKALFIERDDLFGRAGIYDEKGQSYFDNLGRFAFHCKAALQSCKDTQWIPDIIHSHDWQGAATAVFRKTWEAFLSPLSQSASVLTIHNLAYQGVGEKGVLDWMGIGPEHFVPDVLEDHGQVNFLKAAIHFSEAITTVSPTYANEIRTPAGGQGLAPYLSQKGEDLYGILNGIDADVYDPASDKHLPQTFSVNKMDGRKSCRRELQRRMGVSEDDSRCIVAMVSRFAPGKGLDLIEGMLERAIQEMHLQVVFLGSGDPHVQWWLGEMQRKHPGIVGNWIGYHEDLAHILYAGSDLYLMPSLFEPCGLSQMYAMRYGSLPVVRRTGGLTDTVRNYQEWDGGGDGFVFDDYRPESLYYTLGWAVSTFFDRPHHFQAMRRRVMERDFSWDADVRKYEEVYRHAIAKLG